jgi:hypothetical protein
MFVEIRMAQHRDQLLPVRSESYGEDLTRREAHEAIDQMFDVIEAKVNELQGSGQTTGS